MAGLGHPRTIDLHPFETFKQNAIGDSGGFVDSETLPKVVRIEVESLADLSRLAVTMASYAVIMPIYGFREGDEIYLFVQATYKDYYKYYGIPLIYYYRTKDESIARGKYVLIKVDETGEKVEISDRSRPGWTAIPLIWLKTKPEPLL